MPDADVAITAGSGTKIDTRTVGAGTDEHRQVVVLGDPTTAANVAAVLGTGNLSVAPVNVVSTANSTTSVLGAGAAFTGTSEDILAYAMVFVNVFASHASATDGLSIQMSSNGTNWDIVDTYTVAATASKVIAVNPAAQFFRIVYTNGGTLQTSFRLQTVFKRFHAHPSSSRAVDGQTNEQDMAQVQGFGMLWNGTTWDRMPGSAAFGQTNRQVPSATSTLANVASSATNVTLRASSTGRLGLMLYNDSTSVCFVKFGATASATSYTLQMGPTAYYEMPQPLYTGIVDGIWSSANGNMRVTELT
jgi:hypothetical protein